MALGALSYYLGDTVGHSEAINPATAIEFLNLECKYGRSVTYGERLHGHIRTEFAFDIDELTDYAFAPPAYLRYIGFKVPRKFLEQAYRIFAERALVRVMSDSGSTLTADPDSRPICWQFWCLSFPRSARLQISP